MYKKIFLSSAIAAALGTSGFAQAAVDLNDSDATANGSLTYASEISVASAGTTLSDSAADAQNLTANLGFSVNGGSTRFVRVDLGADATFTNAPDLTVTDGAATATGTISSGGAGESFVIFEFTATDGAGADFDLGPTDTVNVDVDGVDVVSQADVTASYQLFETGTAAANEGTSLAAASQTVYRFADALEITVEDAGEETIEVATNSTEFENGVLVTPVAQLEIGVNGNFFTDSEAAVLGDLVANDTALEISGDFSAVALDGNGDPDVTDVQLNGADADTLTSSLATFVIDATGYADGAEAIVSMTVTGDDEIVDGPYSGVYNVVAAANADTTDQNLGELSNLEKNGSTATANLVLTPTTEGGVFRNFLRVSNNSNIDGRVFVRVRNDLGESASFALGDVAGQETVLPGQQATSLISTDDLFAAAAAANANLEIGADGRNKLRVTVEGEFTSIALDNISVSRDNQSFSTFQ